MARPETHDDLLAYERQSHLVATVQADYVIRYPSLGQHLLAALAEAERIGLTITDGEIRLAKTSEELDTALANRQRVWDASAERYEKALVDPASVPESYWRNDVDRWAAAEGRDPIVWPVDQAVS